MTRQLSTHQLAVHVSSYLGDELSVQCLRHYIGSWSGFKVPTARPATKRPVQSLSLGHETSLYARLHTKRQHHT